MRHSAERTQSPVQLLTSAWVCRGFRAPWGTLCCRKIGQFRKRGFSYKKPFLPSSSGIYRNQGSRRKSVRADLRLNSHPFASVFWLSRPHPMIILGSVFVSGSHAFAGVFFNRPHRIKDNVCAAQVDEVDGASTNRRTCRAAFGELWLETCMHAATHSVHDFMHF